MSRVARFLLLLLLGALAAQADTIVLKSGRRISATSVVEEGDRVYYETQAGRLSFPKSIVERIERGGFAPSATGSGPAIFIPAPQADLAQGFEDITQTLLRGGTVDGNYLAELEREARSGGARTIERLAAGHHAAAQFWVGKGEVEQAIGHYRRVLDFAPEHPGALVNLAYLHGRRSEYTRALEYLERARRVDPDSADVAHLMGWAYYGLNRIDLAVKELQRSLRLRPDREVEVLLARALRDQEAERRYIEDVARHFNLRYAGEAAPRLAREILDTLETHFRTIEGELRYTPPEPVGVILYTQQAFADILGAPDWSGALNDGRIRVPAQGFPGMTPQLSSSLMHELAHSFIRQKTRENAPVWLHEGIAQWFQGRRSDSWANFFVSAQEKRNAVVSLAKMEGVWLRLPGEVVYTYYGWSLCVVEYIVERHGMTDLVRILERLTSEPSAEAAIQSVLRMDYAELQQETLEYLRRTYVR